MILNRLKRIRPNYSDPQVFERDFSRVWDRYRKPILRYVAVRVPNDEIANELTQEVFLKAYRFRESYSEKYAFSTWLWTIARNTVADHLRGNRVEGAELPEDLPCPGACPETRALARDERRIFLRVMRGLTRAQRRVLRLRFVHQLSYPEISRKLGISLTAVKNLAYRAKQTLVSPAGAALLLYGAPAPQGADV